MDTCVRCGSFVCDDCVELLGEEAFCQPCYQRREVTGRPSTRATLALLFAASGLLCGAPLAIPGLVLAGLERRALRRGTAPFSSKTYVNVAWVLGWIGVALTALLALAFLGTLAWAAWSGADPAPPQSP